MKNRVKGLIYFGMISLMAITVISCDNESDNIYQTGTLKVKMTDAPAEYSSVNFELESILVHYAEESDTTSGWYEVETNQGIYDLLELTNGNDTLIASGLIPAGKITQMRFILGSNNNVITSTMDTVSLKVPSGMESGIKININKELAAEGNLELLLDFDAELSITVNGQGELILNPVIKLIDN